MSDSTSITANPAETVSVIGLRRGTITDAPPVCRADTGFELRGLAWSPLCDAAMPLFGLLIRLHSLEHHKDVAQLYQNVHNQITTVMEEVSQLDYDPGTLKAYSYSLCLLADEIVMDTPWGKYSTWSQRSLLSAFHQETWGGEKFFTLLAHMTAEAAKYQHVLEFMYLCLCMGLKGKYGNQAKGDEEVQKIITRLYRVIRPRHGETPECLTDPLTHVAPRHYRLNRQWPLWTPWALAAVVLASAYTIYAVRLNTLTQQVLTSLERILNL
ncbi:hypothetical protein C1886_24510 [Pseudomonas sp. FW300-N1A1]|uniref:type IVB secretion system protein IcmH/DotU n=1 Tax=Pseudomonas sp. FW300-N1A1 TaxID=2075555 RepID=UPI000CD245DC|nr:type IVB secretion system protein IcmH/DotU [Pseudomonas sp. FW300-N1A1]POA16945.1 hypothetical protein C1886_24510 [Pseudomonas sp. FW300-N1A1]